MTDLLAESEGWTLSPLWFVKLSGWPIFLIIVGAAICFAVFASAILTKTGNRSAVQVMLFASLAVGAIGIGLAHRVTIYLTNP